MEPKNIIRERREALGLTEQQLADRVGVSRGSVQHWERTGGTAPSRKRQQAVADALGITLAELTTGIAEAAQESHGVSQNDDGSVTIPQYQTGGAMGGAGIQLRDQPGVIKGWLVNSEWVQKNARNFTSPGNLAIVTGFGDSMRPLYHPGDPLLIDTGVKSVDYDGIYFFRVGSEGFVKRLQRIPGEGILAISENRAYRDWTITPSMDLEVFGRVIRAWVGEDY